MSLLCRIHHTSGRYTSNSTPCPARCRPTRGRSNSSCKCQQRAIKLLHCLPHQIQTLLVMYVVIKGQWQESIADTTTAISFWSGYINLRSSISMSSNTSRTSSRLDNWVFIMAKPLECNSMSLERCSISEETRFWTCLDYFYKMNTFMKWTTFIKVSCN